MKKNTLITGLICFFIFNALTFPVSAQTDQIRELPQFVFEKFTKGTVKMKAGNKYAASLNYNMYYEEMILEQRGNYIPLANINEIDTVYIQDRIFVPAEGVFFELISAGIVSFFIQHKVRYSQQGTPTAYGITSPTNSSVKVTSVKGANSFRSLEIPDDVTLSPANVNWLRINGNIEKFTGEKSFLKFFPDIEDELKKFIKTNKTNFRSREDLIKLCDYCNRL